MTELYTIGVVEDDFIWILDDNVSVNLNLAMSLMDKMSALFPNVRYVVVNARTGAY